ncbi:MAG TPA: hypothetical protein VF721_11175 [Pyrinomonadaceae bacterium]|jgi:hypothetical protein
MNKHIFGFALFSFIVGVAIAVSGFLAFKTVKVNVFEVNKTPRFEDRNYCRKEKFKNYGDADVKVEQAVLDVNTKQLKTFLWLNPRVKAEKNYLIALNFFVKNEKQTRHVKTELISANSAFDWEKEAILSSLGWLEKLESYDNLYVVAEVEGSRANYKSQLFDYENAAPVLLSKGKDF